MKTLIIIRHSKSSWKDHSLSDFDRPLNKRGIKDAKKMSFELSGKIKRVDLLLSSSSKRTTQTSNYFLDSMNIRSNIFSENLYHSSSNLIFDCILKSSSRSYCKKSYMEKNWQSSQNFWCSNSNR